MIKRTVLFISLLSAGMLALVACGSDDPAASATPSPSVTSTPSAQRTPTAEPQNIQLAFSEKDRVESPDVPAADILELADGNTVFAMNLYRQLASEDGNLFMSPYSISVALAMTYSGARGETESEMADALKFTLSQQDLHAAFNALDQELATRGQDVPADEKFTLEIANSIWGQRGFEFEQAFLDTLGENYGSGLRLVDFVDPETREAARLAINGWVEDNTNDRIEDLIGEGVLNEMTRLVLANAIFFKASWLMPFEAQNTTTADFTLLNGDTAQVDMMSMTFQRTFNYGDGDGYEALEMRYSGNDTSMLVLLPDEGEFESFETGLTAEKLNEIIADMSFEKGTVSFPKFEFDSKFSLPDALKALGMEQAFDGGLANFTGMRSQPPSLVIADVIHQSFVSVDEEGTEAAASTAVTIELTSAPPSTFQFTADSPFIFLIRDIETGTVLFMGRFLGPEA